jgi:hypothetical protein
VYEPALPRVLLLQASPNVEAARLQRWLAQSGAAVSSRTRISTEHHRFASANGAPAEIDALTDPLLAGFDMIVTTEAALAELSAEERGKVENAVRDGGLGVLVLGEPAAGKRDEFFAPWPGAGAPGAAGDDNLRVVRLRLADGSELGEPASALEGELASLPLSRWLARDSGNRMLAAAVARGRGWVARSLIVDTWHWGQEGHPEVFATFWSSLLSAVARTTLPTTGTWQIENPHEFPRVDRPVRLVWAGPDGKMPSAVQVESAGSPPIALTLTRSTVEKGRGHAILWPTQSGWNRVRANDGSGAFSFYVQAAGALPGLVRAERHRATARMVAESTGAPARISTVGNFGSGAHQRRTDIAAYVLFVIGAGYLWLEQRRRRPARG